MIIKGGAAGNVSFWSSHLLRVDTNERAEVKGIKGLLADTLPAALREMRAVAAGSRSQGNFMYQANLNPRADEKLTPEQWDKAIDTLERNMGLTGHQRVVVEHVKEGREHRHVIWNRVDVETMRVADIGGNYRTHEQTARQLETEFGLTPTPTPPVAERKAAPELWEMRAAERSGIDPKALKQEMTALWFAADSGQAFMAAVQDRGLIIAKGDRRDFVIVDQAGDTHSLARRLDGVKAAEVRERMADVDRDSLPTVDRARTIQRGYAEVERDLGYQAWNAKGEVTGWSEEAAQAREDRAETESAFYLAGREMAARLAEDAAPQAEAAPTVEATEAAPIDRGHQGDGTVANDNTPEHEPVDMADGADRAIASAGKAAAMVLSFAADRIGDLIEFAAGLLDGGDSRPKPTPAQAYRARQESLAAMADILDSINNDRAIDAATVAKLSPTALQTIVNKGETWLHQQADQEKDRERDRGRGLER